MSFTTKFYQFTGAQRGGLIDDKFQIEVDLNKALAGQDPPRFIRATDEYQVKEIESHPMFTGILEDAHGNRKPFTKMIIPWTDAKPASEGDEPTVQIKHVEVKHPLLDGYTEAELEGLKQLDAEAFEILRENALALLGQKTNAGKSGDVTETTEVVEKSLAKMNKAELVAKGESLGLPIDSTLTNEQIRLQIQDHLEAKEA